VVRARLASERKTALDPGPSPEYARRAVVLARAIGDERWLLSAIRTGSGASMGFAPAE
jgi:hypothetical protein